MNGKGYTNNGCPCHNDLLNEVGAHHGSHSANYRVQHDKDHQNCSAPDERNTKDYVEDYTASLILRREENCVRYDEQNCNDEPWAFWPESVRNKVRES